MIYPRAGTGKRNGLAGCAVERHAVTIKAQGGRWAWAGVKHGAPEGQADFMALSARERQAANDHGKGDDSAWVDVLAEDVRDQYQRQEG